MLVSVGLAQLGQREGEAGGEEERRVHHRQQDHQSGYTCRREGMTTVITCRMSSDA